MTELHALRPRVDRVAGCARGIAVRNVALIEVIALEVELNDPHPARHVNGIRVPAPRRAARSGVAPHAVACG